eukprot:scaffold6502_cov187-Alexandrium_tamarense.AAC.8
MTVHPIRRGTGNAHRLQLYRYLLFLGVVITFLSSIALIAWHEHIIDLQQLRSPFFELGNQPASVSSSASAQQTRVNDKIAANLDDWPPILSAYMEPSSSYDVWYEDPSSDIPMVKQPLQQRNIQSHQLKRLSFTKLQYTSNEMTTSLCSRIPSLLPIDDFGTTILDPYLPWIHDLFVSHDGSEVNVIAQNRRRCHKGKNHKDEMKFWEGQVSLFQPVALKRIYNKVNADAQATTYNEDDSVEYRLSTHEEADTDAIETRFRCRFKLVDYEQQTITYQGETLSTYTFNYEFVNWRKQKRTMVEDGKEQTMFWLSPLMFNCPIPTHLLKYARSSRLLLDLVPIRTPARRNDRDGFFFHSGHGGPMTFNATTWWGTNHVLPKVEVSGRWENLPVCGLKSPLAEKNVLQDTNNAQYQPDDTTAISINKPHRLVACTWTSALHQRRGNERRITDGKARLREWIAFHLEAGFDHMYVFDNTGANATIFKLKNEIDPDFGTETTNDQIRDDLSSVTNLFPSSKVTRIDWPATICNNNRPAHDDPGERSSQYAAEAACRVRYGPYSDWMASMDPDEYFIPMGNYSSWKEILDKVDRNEGRKVLKFRSTRARPLLSRLEPTYDEGAKECTHEMGKTHNQCLTKKQDTTYLETYNCEYIRSPKPERFSRAMVRQQTTLLFNILLNYHI